jgi:hypothetical protein
VHVIKLTMQRDITLYVWVHPEERWGQSIPVLSRAPWSTAPANRPYHFVDLRFFTVDGGIGAKQRPFHGAMADAG